MSSSTTSRFGMHNSSKPTAAPLIPARFSQDNPGVSDVPSDAPQLDDSQANDHVRASVTSGVGSVTELGAARTHSDVASKPIAHKSHTKPELESLDFTTFPSLVNQAHGLYPFKRKALQGVRYIFTFFVGVITALVAFGIKRGVEYFSKKKFEVLQTLLNVTTLCGEDNTLRNGGCSNRYSGSLGPGTGKFKAPSGSTSPDANDPQRIFLAYLGFVAVCVLYGLVAGCLVIFVEPCAAGSGISEIKTLLNGVKLPRIVRIKTLIVKVIGVLFSVSAGLPVGKEGPMIHSGSIVGAGLAQGKSSTLGFDTSWTKFMHFRTHVEKRDFIACGASAGVAAAFGAPIGGMLFALEEGASYWSPDLTWRTFFCAVTCAFFLNLLLTGTQYGLDGLDWGYLGSDNGTFSFGVFQNKDYYFALMLIFCAMGCTGGLAGAWFNSLNTRITRLRMRHVNHSRTRRLIEVVTVVATVATCAFVLPLAFGKCTDITLVQSDSVLQVQQRLVPYFCNKPGQYNDLASLFLVPAEDAISQLLHLTPAGNSTDSGWGVFPHAIDPADPTWALHPVTTLIFVVFFYHLACWTYGIGVPSGLFVPSLLAGAAYGKLCADICAWALPVHEQHRGLFVVVGAASMLGGMARVTLSLTVILIELTGALSWTPPLAIALLCSRWMGNLFNEGLYDIHIHLRGWPLLEANMPSGGDTLLVADLISNDALVDASASENSSIFRPLRTLNLVERVGAVLDLLRGTKHNGFPVMCGDALGGLVLRKQLLVLLARRDFFKKVPTPWTRRPRPMPPPGEEPEDLHDWHENGADAEGEAADADGRAAVVYRTGQSSVVPAVLPDGLCLNHFDMEGLHPRYPTLEAVEATTTEDDRELWMDLSPYINASPEVINVSTPVFCAYKKFRGDALRHLLVVPDPVAGISQSALVNNGQDGTSTAARAGREGHPSLVGILTRADFTEHNLELRAAALETAMRNTSIDAYTMTTGTTERSASTVTPAPAASGDGGDGALKRRSASELPPITIDMATGDIAHRRRIASDLVDVSGHTRQVSALLLRPRYPVTGASRFGRRTSLATQQDHSERFRNSNSNSANGSSTSSITGMSIN